MLQDFPPVLILISLSTVPLAGLLWKYKGNHHFWVNDSSPIFLFWHLLMAVDISATAQQGKNGNPDLSTQVNSFPSHARQYSAPCHSNSSLACHCQFFPSHPISGYTLVIILAVFQVGAFLSIHASFHSHLFLSPYIYTTVIRSALLHFNI